MRNVTVAALAAATIFAAAPAEAEPGPMTGNALLAACTGDAADRIFCLGYVAGISDYGTVIGLARDAAQVRAAMPPEMLFCRAPGSTNGQLAAVVVAYARAHPARLHLSALVLVTDALHDAFPCGEHPDVAD